MENQNNEHTDYLDIPETIYEILAGNLSGEPLSAEENRLLETWKQTHPANQAIYEQFRSLMERNSGILRGNDRKILFEQIQQRIKTQEAKRQKQKHLAWLSAAASILITLGMFYYFSSNHHPEIKTPTPAAQQIKPGESKALLQLATGEIIPLDARQQEYIVVDSTFEIKNQAHTLIYDTKDSTTKNITYNTLSVPMGAEYKVILSDGTKVYLNSGSGLHYPTGFTGKNREVCLIGEAYFEVAKDTLHPLIVKTGQMSIRVLGTSFNVKAYPTQEQTAATLEEGKIQVTCRGKSYDITPGNQITYNTTNRKTEIKEVDTELYTSWKSGYYKFEQMSLQEIMSTLALWYDLNIFYQNPETKDILFTGRLKRYENVENLLKKFEQTNEIKFIIKERSVTIKKK